MKKYLLSLLFTSTLSYAGLVNGIALIVNDTPITLYDIDEKMENNNISKQEAVEMILEETLYDQEIQKQNISVDIFDIDNYIKQLADQNNMNLLDFKSVIRQQQNYDQFKKNIKKQLMHQKLIAKIAKGKIKPADEEDLKIYYENNQNLFKIANTIDVIAYISKDKQLLENIQNNPMAQNDNVLVQNISLKQSELSPQIKYIVNSTDEKEFSIIFINNKNYNMFYISDKKDIQTIPFDSVKNQIFNTIMKDKEQSYLKEYFETLKVTANIEILK